MSDRTWRVRSTAPSVEGAAGACGGQDVEGAGHGAVVRGGPGLYPLRHGRFLGGVPEDGGGYGRLEAVDVVAQGRAREGAPPVVAGEGLDVVAEPVDPEPGPEGGVDRRRESG